MKILKHQTVLFFYHIIPIVLIVFFFNLFLHITFIKTYHFVGWLLVTLIRKRPEATDFIFSVR